MTEFRVRLTCGDRFIVCTQGARFFISLRAFGIRLRLFSPFPHVWMGRA
jgi:hypothetical protein